MNRLLTASLIGLLSCSLPSGRQAQAQQTAATTPRQRALQDEKSGANAEAAEIWHRITEQDPRDTEAWSHLGLTLALQGKYEDAIPAYQHALKLNRGLPGVQLDLGLALFKQQRLKEAVAAFQAAQKADPANPKPKLLLGMAYYGLAQYAEAIPYLKFAVTASPQNLELRTALAQSCLWSGQYACVLAQYREILEIDPNSAEADILAGEASDGLGDTAQAVASFREAERVAPHTPEVHFGLGYLLWKQHHYDEAKAELEQEVQENPNHAQALVYLGDIALKNGDNGAARSYLDRAIARPGKPVRLAYVDRGILNASQNKTDEAQSDFERAIQLDPNEPDAHWRLARLYKVLGKKADAEMELAKVSKLHEEKDHGLVQRMSAPASAAHSQ